MVNSGRDRSSLIAVVAYVPQSSSSSRAGTARQRRPGLVEVLPHLAGELAILVELGPQRHALAQQGALLARPDPEPIERQPQLRAHLRESVAGERALRI